MYINSVLLLKGNMKEIEIGFIYVYLVGMIRRALHQLEIHYFFWAVDWEIVYLCSLVVEWDPQDWHPV